MKRPLLAAAFVLASLTAFARNGSGAGAYGSLVGMAQSATEDAGPDAGELPPDRARVPEGLRDAVAQPPAVRIAATPASAARPGSAGPAAPASAPDPRVVAAPPPAAPRIWTRLYATLLPSWRPRGAVAASSAPALSTATFRAVPAPLPADKDGVLAGEVRGLAELVSASAAPAQ